MKKGIPGYQANCNNLFGIWGISCNAPNVEPSEHGRGSAGELRDREFPYFAEGWTNDFSVSVQKDVYPSLWPHANGKVWGLYAAKVPISYPGPGCDKLPPVSSSTELGDASWQSSLGTVMEYEIWQADGIPDVDIHSIRDGWAYAFGSRAIYIDGEQRYLAYRRTGTFPGSKGSMNVNNPPTPSHSVIGSTYIINIETQGVSGYNTDNILGNLYNYPDQPNDPTYMEGQYRYFEPEGILNNGSANVENLQFPAQNLQFGKDYAVLSSYRPSINRTYEGWQVVRLKYEGTRLPSTGARQDAVEVFSSHSANSTSGENVGKLDTPYSTTGDYIIMLPSVRSYMSNAVINSGIQDEPYVCAIHKQEATKVITAKWQSKCFRPGVGDEGEGTGIADGTISPDEAAAGNVILDASYPPSGYTSEDVANFKLYCYNRVWDPIRHQNVDLVLFSTSATGGPSSTYSPLADFEPLPGSGTGNLHNGLSGGMTFTSNGEPPGNNWMSDTTDAYTADGGSWSAITNNNVNFIGVSNLSITVSVVNTSDITFKYRLDNRSYGERVPPFINLTNNPNPDNNLRFYVDGNIVQTFDMVNYPAGNPFNDPSFYTTWYDYTYSLAPGTHTIRWTLSREFAGDVLVAGLDHIQFPEILLGDDIDGGTRGYYDGSGVRKLNVWAWPRRDEEDEQVIASRGSTKAEYITMDGEGGILVGNPHWVARLNRDGSVDTTFGGPRGDGFITDSGGYIRFTASNNIEAPALPCFADLPSAGVDIVSDPPWGSFQILPVGGRDFQVRGANAALRDATSYPISTGLYTYTGRNGKVIQESFYPFLHVQQSSLWSMRPHGWSITDNGKELIPHVEVIWRPTLHIEAWPGPSGEWIHPPYRTDFPYSTITGEWAPDSTRPRNPLFIRTADTTGIAIWSMSNFIIPRTYCDAWSTVPQAVWVRNTNDSPSNSSDPDWWDPNSTESDIAALFGPFDTTHGGPWGSAKWKLVTGRFNPCGFRNLNYTPSETLENFCDVYSDDADPVYTTVAIWRPTFGTNNAFYGFTDFDAIQNGDRAGC